MFPPSSILIALTVVGSLYCLVSAAVARKLQTISWREQASAIRERTSGCSPTQHKPLCCMYSRFKCTLSLSASLHLILIKPYCHFSLLFCDFCLHALNTAFVPNQTWMNVDHNYDCCECSPVNFKINRCSLFILRFFKNVFSVWALKLTWKRKSFYFINVRIQQQHVLCGVCGHQQSRLGLYVYANQNIYSRTAHSPGL